MRKKLYEVKTLEEAKKLAVSDFGVKESDLTFTVVSEKKGFLGIGSKLTVEAEVSVDGISRAKNTSKPSSRTTAFRASWKRKSAGIMLSSILKLGISTVV